MMFSSFQIWPSGCREPDWPEGQLQSGHRELSWWCGFHKVNIVTYWESAELPYCHPLLFLKGMFGWKVAMHLKCRVCTDGALIQWLFKSVGFDFWQERRSLWKSLERVKWFTWGHTFWNTKCSFSKEEQLFIFLFFTYFRWNTEASQFLHSQRWALHTWNILSSLYFWIMSAFSRIWRLRFYLPDYTSDTEFNPAPLQPSGNCAPLVFDLGDVSLNAIHFIRWFPGIKN